MKDRKNIYDIIIDTKERFIGKYKHHRISIVEVKLYDEKKFSVDITDMNENMILETYVKLPDIESVISFAKEKISNRD